MKKRLSAILILALVLSLLAGCGGSPSASSADPAAPSDASTNAPGSVESAPPDGPTTLTVAYNLEPASLDLQSVGLSSGGTTTGSFLYDTLVSFDSATNSVQPCVAESWEWVEDTILRMKLRQDVYSHNGFNIVAEDILYMLQRGCETAPLARYYGSVDPGKCAVVDTYTIDIALKSPSPVFLMGLSQSCFAIASKAGIEAQGGLEAFARAPEALTGKYKFVEWVSGDHVTVERNEDYWGEKAYYDTATIRYIPDDTSRLMALQSGDVDAVNRVLTSQSSTITEGSGMSLVTIDNQLQMYNLILNCSSGPLSNVKVRQAMNYAFNREAALQAILFGYGSVADGLFPEGFSVYSAPKSGEEWTYDLEKAKSLMAEAGYPDGFDMTVILMENQMYSDVAEFAQNAWSQLNINLNIEISDSATFFVKLNSGEYDAYSIANSGYDYTSVFKTYDNRLTYGQGGNSQFYHDDSFYDLLDQIYTELDPAKAAEISGQIQSVLRNEVPVIDVMNGSILFACDSDLTGYYLSPMGDPIFASLRPAA